MEEKKETKVTDEVMRLNYENNLLKNKLKEVSSVIEELSNQRGIQRLDFLFRIIENKSGRFTEDIIAKAVAEISEAMFPEEKEADNE